MITQKNVNKMVLWMRWLSYLILFCGAFMLSHSAQHGWSQPWLALGIITFLAGIVTTLIELHYSDRRRRGW